MTQYLRQLWRFYCYHLDVLMFSFQGVLHDVNILHNLKAHKYRYHYLFPFTLAAVIVIDTLIQYHEQSFDVNDPYPVYFHRLILHFSKYPFQLSIPSLPNSSVL